MQFVSHLIVSSSVVAWSDSVAEWLQYLVGQWNDRGSNPGSAICLE